MCDCERLRCYWSSSPSDDPESVDWLAYQVMPSVMTGTFFLTVLIVLAYGPRNERRSRPLRSQLRLADTLHYDDSSYVSLLFLFWRGRENVHLCEHCIDVSTHHCHPQTGIEWAPYMAVFQPGLPCYWPKKIGVYASSTRDMSGDRVLLAERDVPSLPLPSTVNIRFARPVLMLHQYLVLELRGKYTVCVCVCVCVCVVA